ncbi:MAG: XdhC family protein [Chloroflexi bacterium]|jgi:xanthine dehydrogenase accessory factor|nr:XdhC family protein [Chloroflexota bacterium]
MPVHPRTELYRTAATRLARGERAALATVVATRGSTPQKPGAALLMLSDGTMHGTIGGGCVEADVWAEAQRLMRRGESALREFVLADDPDHPGGDVCGGTMEVFIDVLSPPPHDLDGAVRVGHPA